MGKSIGSKQLNLRSFRSVTRHIGERSIPERHALHEKQDQSTTQTDDKTDLRYLVMSVPKDASNDEKADRLAEFSDVVTNITNSDVFLLGMWIP